MKLYGTIKIPGCKSCSHRSLIMSAISIGKTDISNLLEADDIKSTIRILRQLGIKIHKVKNKWVVYGNGTNGFLQPKKSLDAGNSGTSCRTIIGAVSSNPITCKFVGDRSLSSRSMSRITKYLEELGAKVKLTRKDFLPLTIDGSDNLVPKKIEIEKPSAQIKTALIFAGLNIHGKFTIKEKVQTRDHTENLLSYLNVKYKLRKSKNGSSTIELNGPYEIKSKNISVPGDASSAAFFIVGAIITPGSEITLKEVSLNPTRIAYIHILKKMGARINIKKSKNVSGEQCGSLHVKFSKLKAIKIKSSMAPFLIDEYPILAIAASCAKGITVMKGLNELRHKESDRIKSIVTNLNRAGIKTKSVKDDIHIYGSDQIIEKSCKIKSYDDHRIACSFMILRLINKNIKIDNEKCVSISYPNFKNDLRRLISN